MKVEIKVNESLTVHAEGDNPKDVFKQIASAQETFEDSKCGHCGNKNLRYVVRKVEDNEFYELHCTNGNCRAKLAFGSSKKDNKLYPKRYQTEAKGKAKRDENGKAIPLGKWGWHIYKAGEQVQHDAEEF